MDELSFLLDPDSGGTPQERALALAAALRGQRPPGMDGGTAEQALQDVRTQRAVGNLGLLTGDRVLVPFGRAQLEGADRQQAMEAEAEQRRAGGILRAALQTEAARRAAAAKETQRGWSEEQRALDRASRERAAAIQAGDRATQQQLENEAGLRKELQGNKVVQEYQLSAVAFDKVRRAAADDTPAGDLALIFGYMKTLDPTSAVREGEFANAQNAASIPERVRNAYNRAVSGTRLSPEQRQEFIKSAAGQFGAVKQRAESLIGGYRDIANDVGVSPERVVVPGTVVPDIDLSTPPSGGQPTPPAAGPRVVDVKGMKPGDLAKSLQEGEAVRIKQTGQVVRKKDGKLIKVKE